MKNKSLRRTLINTVLIADCVCQTRPNQFLSALFCIRTVLTAPKAADRRIMKTTLIWKMKFARKAAIITITSAGSLDFVTPVIISKTTDIMTAATPVFIPVSSVLMITLDLKAA